MMINSEDAENFSATASSDKWIIIYNCLREAVDFLSEGDFHPRTGGSKEDVTAIMSALKEHLPSQPWVKIRLRNLLKIEDAKI